MQTVFLQISVFSYVSDSKRIQFVSQKQTDFEEDAEISEQVKNNFSILQKVQCFVNDGKNIITGGVDGKVRIWDFPDMKTHKIFVDIESIVSALPISS